MSFETKTGTDMQKTRSRLCATEENSVSTTPLRRPVFDEFDVTTLSFNTETGVYGTVMNFVSTGLLRELVFRQIRRVSMLRLMYKSKINVKKQNQKQKPTQKQEKTGTTIICRTDGAWIP